jgi:hypothetical protein
LFRKILSDWHNEVTVKVDKREWISLDWIHRLVLNRLQVLPLVLTVVVTVLYRSSCAGRRNLISGAIQIRITVKFRVKCRDSLTFRCKQNVHDPVLLFFLPISQVAWRVGEQSGNFVPYSACIGGPLRIKQGFIFHFCNYFP